MVIETSNIPYNCSPLEELLSSRGLDIGIIEAVVQYAPSPVFTNPIIKTIVVDKLGNIFNERFEPRYTWQFLHEKDLKLTQAQRTIFKAINKNKVGLGKKDQRSKYLKRILKGKN